VDVSFQITRAIRALKKENLSGADAGYEETATLELAEDCPVGVGLWNLVQVPLGGTVYIPAEKTDHCTAFFGQSGDAVSFERGRMATEFTADREDFFKVGLKASWIRPVIAYVRQEVNGSMRVVVRTFEIGEDSEHVDTPWQDPADPGYAAQLFYGGKEHGFGELEYHAPAASPRAVRASRLFALTGSRERAAAFLREFDIAI
jgi:hypothetical protein